jgi:hypothetical protein
MICPSNHQLVSAKVATLQHQDPRHGTGSVRRTKALLLGTVWLLGLGLALNAAPASAQYFVLKHKAAHHPAPHGNKEPFGNIPKGPMQAIISISQQRLHFYSDGKHIMDVPVATGVPGHLTPLGVFSVIQRDRYHHSNIYSNAPMPFMERITWSGVALHEGPGVGHQASHGCIRMPHDFAARLWQLPTMGMRVIIAHSELRPVDFADPHLFVHKDKQTIAALPKPIETAQTGTGIKTDAAAPLIPPPAAANAGTAQAAPDAAAAQLPSSAAPAEATAAQPGTTQPKPQEPNNAAAQTAAPAATTMPVALEDVPLPLAKPDSVAKGGGGPIAIFVSRKLGKIFVRQNFAPVFEAPVKIDHPERPLGTHVFTALDWMPDHSTLRWNVVSLPGEATRTVEHSKYVRDVYGRRHLERVRERVVEPAATEPADQVLARIDIPQDVTDQISQLIVPGSSLVVSDQGLGPETGSSGTDFIVVTR